MVNYVISGIWLSSKNNSEHISHVMIHRVENGKFKEGDKISKGELINLMNNDNIIKTIMWDYETCSWSKGEEVTADQLTSEYLRKPDGTVKNHLHSLIRMGFLGI